MYKVIYSKCFILEASNGTIRALNKRLLQPPVTSAYYALCFGNCCPSQPTAMFCVAFAQPRKTRSTRQPQCVPSHIPAGRGPGPHSKKQQPQSAPAPAATCRLPPWRCYGAFWHGRRAHIPLSPTPGMTNGRATSPVQSCLLTVSPPPLFSWRAGGGWVPFGLFFLPFILEKGQGALRRAPGPPMLP